MKLGDKTIVKNNVCLHVFVFLCVYRHTHIHTNAHVFNKRDWENIFARHMTENPVTITSNNC